MVDGWDWHIATRARISSEYDNICEAEDSFTCVSLHKSFSYFLSPP